MATKRKLTDSPNAELIDFLHGMSLASLSDLSSLFCRIGGIREECLPADSQVQRLSQGGHFDRQSRTQDRNDQRYQRTGEREENATEREREVFVAFRKASARRSKRRSDSICPRGKSKNWRTIEPIRRVWRSIK